MRQRVYLAARYSRREELCGYAKELRAMGYLVDARWLLGEHQIHDRALAVEAATQTIPPEGLLFAQDDVADVLAAQIVICFSEAPRSGNSRGGRHVEFGMALALKVVGYQRAPRLIVVGPRENVFHCLPEVEVYASWERVKSLLGEVKP